MSLADEINYATFPPTSATARNHVLIFFVPGNPGLIDYYGRFLDIVRKRLNARASNQDTHYYIHGASLAGFDVSSGSRKTPGATEGLPLSLDDQVRDVYSRLETTATRLRSENKVKEDLSVVLIGHSIGAYMVLQSVAHWQKLARQGPTYMNLMAGICLFPTIYELALSPTGRQVGPLTRIPAFALIVHTVAKILFCLAPLDIVTSLVQLVTRMPLNGATVTAHFLQSRYGVWQALHMAKDELAQLTHDQWSDEFWGGAPTAIDDASSTTLSMPSGRISEPSRPARSPTDGSHTQLFFYWGSDDHWIATETRDKIIATRARVDGEPGHERRPVMEIDNHGIGHAFCLTESGNQVVASKCADWIESISH